MERRAPAMLHFRRGSEIAEEVRQRSILRRDQSPESLRWWPSRRECPPLLALSLLLLLTAMLLATRLEVRSAPDPCSRPTFRPTVAPTPCQQHSGTPRD